MLNNVPTGINKAVRNVVIRHPNAFDCEIFRKTVNRTGDAVVGGLPTLGGLGVISSDDEEDISWTFVGDGFALRVDPFASSMMMDQRDANNDFEDEMRFLIEPETPGAATPKKNDVFYLLITDQVSLAFEIVGIETTSNIPPFTQRYICNRRPDLFVTP